MNKGKCTKCVYIVCLRVCASTQCIKEIHRQLKASFIFITTSQAPQGTTTAIATATTITTKTTIYDSKQAGPVFLWLSLAHLIESAFTHTNTSSHTHRPSHIDSHPHPHPHPLTHTHTLAKAVSKTNGIGGVGKERRNKRN